MTADPDTVGPDVTVKEAARLIHESGHNRLPVVDGEGKLLGIVTRMEYDSFGIGHAPSPLIQKNPPYTGRPSATHAGARVLTKSL